MREHVLAFGDGEFTSAADVADATATDADVVAEVAVVVSDEFFHWQQLITAGAGKGGVVGGVVNHDVDFFGFG